MRGIYLLFLVFIGRGGAESPLHPPNVCSNPLEYTAINPLAIGCTYNPDVDAVLPDLVQNHGYDVEEIPVTTDDGYILNLMHLFVPNLKRNNTKGTILFLHPSLATAAVWVDKGENQSLGYRAFNNGYDVYLGNFRGNPYSRKHTVYDPDKNSSKFWNFSYHEMGTKDIPAMIKQIRSRNGGRKVTLIGHSMGGSATMIYASLKPTEASQHIKMAILMAPAVYLSHVLSPFALPSAVLSPLIYEIFNTINHREVFAINSRPINFLKKICLRFLSGRVLCDLLFAFGFGPDLGQILYEPHFPITLGQSPAGISLKTLYHYAQSVLHGGNFEEYDYGKEMNIIKYGSPTPPEYPIEHIKVPIYIMYGTMDFLVSVKDSKKLYNRLPTSSQFGLQALEGFNHIHFAYGENIEEKVFNPILSILQEKYA